MFARSARATTSTSDSAAADRCPDVAPTQRTLDDGELLVASVRTPEAFGELYRRCSDELLAFFYRRTEDPHVAADLLAETFAIAFRKRAKYRPSSGPPIAWLYGIGKLELARYYRKQRVELRATKKLKIDVPRLTSDDIARIESLVDIERQRQQLDEAMQSLSAAERTAVQRRVVDGHDYDAIAEETGSSPGAIRVRVHRGLGRLATELSS